MKIRYGFVSNSSSSSFTCLICGETVSGWDMSLTDAEMCSCQRGHLVCQDHKDDYKRATLEEVKAEYAEMTNKCHYYTEEDKNEKIENMNSCDNLAEAISIFTGDFYEGPNCDCPFCTMQEIDESSIKNYLLKESGRTHNQIVNEIKQRFPTRDDLSQYLHPTVMD